MSYASAPTATLTRSGQITIPKTFREYLGLKPGESVVFHKQKNTVAIERKKTVEEVAKEIQELFPADVRQNFQQTAKKTAGEFREEWLKSDATREHYRAEERLNA